MTDTIEKLIIQKSNRSIRCVASIAITADNYDGMCDALDSLKEAIREDEREEANFCMDCGLLHCDCECEKLFPKVDSAAVITPSHI